MKLRTDGKATAEFNVNLSGEYPEAGASGYTKIFEGYRDDGSKSVVVENTFSVAELASIVEAATAAGIGALKLSLRGNLTKAKTYTKAS